VTRIRWKERGRDLFSFIICALVVVAGTILYPLILLFFTLVALVYPLFNRSAAGAQPRPAGSRRGAGR
jgi:hypothetical protein